VFKNVSNVLRVGRVRSNLSQKELAERLGVSKSTVSRWERDSKKIPILKLSQWASICDVVIEMRLSPRRDFKNKSEESICKSCNNRCEGNRIVLGQDIKDGLSVGGLVFYLSGCAVPDDCPYIVEQSFTKS